VRVGRRLLEEVDPSAAGTTGGVYRRGLKRVFDLMVLLLFAPFVLVLVGALALAVRRDGGPGFYAQDRIGRNGRPFRLWKLRSMVIGAEAQLLDLLSVDPAARAEWETHQKLERDPRITPLGHFLRRSSLDELPQLWNVLRGDMSLVGPRPILPEQRALYSGRSYYTLRPGLTGLWQVGDRDRTCFADRAVYDADYSSRLSFPTDLLVLLMTVRVVVHGTGH
jgi:lipopolysaccharide/colanic/teichoic acid biosynthesis glycosyltransferase